jgi:hypothetical protein
MEDSIKSNLINNRKIIIEIRYEPNPQVIDARGTLVSKLKDANIIPNAQWELGIGEIKLVDSLKQNENKQVIFADLQRLTIMSSKKDTNASFMHFFEKTFKVFREVIKTFTIIRIGCRIQGTYKSKSTDYNTIVNNFKELFPSQILLEDYNVKDLRFQIIYQNGQYNIGPINVEDNFIQTEFQNEDVIKSVGFAIDTDNFIIRSKEKEVISDGSIKDVYLASLSVEKSLFDKLNTL